MVLAILVLGIWMLGVTRLTSSVGWYALQTVLLGIVAWHGDPAAGVAFVLLKGVGIPLWLLYLMRRLQCRRDEGLAVAPPWLMLLGTLGIGALLAWQPFNGVVPPTAQPAMGILLIAMLLMLTRRMAISQILGFLVLENGIFLYLVTQQRPMPLLVDLGVLLDVLVWTMMAGLLTFQMKDRFGDVDVALLRELHE